MVKRLIKFLEGFLPGEKIVVIERGHETVIPFDEAAVATLGNDVRFIMLLNRLKKDREILQSRLANERHESMREVDSIQLSIFWCDWLSNTMRKLTIKRIPAYTPPDDDTLERFNQLKGALESA